MKTFVLTGVTSGIGLEAARALARDPEHNIIAGVRRPADAAALRAAVPARQLEVREFDAGRLASVRGFAAGIGEWHGLGANAGLQIVGRLERSADGHEMTFAVNHLANHCLIRELLPRAAADARVVITASGTHDPEDAGARRFGFRGGVYTTARELAEGSGDPTVSEEQRGRDRYSTSKLCVVMSVYEWARREPRAKFFAYDPGLVPGTGLARNRGVLTWMWKHVLPLVALAMPGASTAPRSGAALAWMLTAPELAGKSGLHYDFSRRETPSSKDSRRLDWARDLHDTSDALTRQA